MANKQIKERLHNMNKRKTNILPIYDPLIKSYLHIGMPFSVLPPQYIQSGWVYESYIQVVYHKEDPEDAFLDFQDPIFWEDKDVFTKGFMAFPARNKKERWQMLEGLKEQIDNGYYVYGDWDEYYVPGTPFFGRHFFRHYFFIYGYEANKIYTEGYLQDGHWHRFEIEEEAFVQALLQNNDRDSNGMISVNTYRPRINFRGRFEWEVVKEGIWEYLYSDDYRKGMSAICDFFADVCQSIRIGGEFPIQSISIVYEHKVLMLERIRYMAKHGFGNCKETDVLQYEIITKGFYTVLCSCMKYKITRKTKWAEQIEGKVKELLEHEKSILERVI